MNASGLAAFKRELLKWPISLANPASMQYADAVLTEEGRQQCLAAVPDAPSVDLVVVSPLRRCLETAFLLFGIGGEVPRFVVHELCRERYGQFTCDVRRPMSENRA